MQAEGARPLVLQNVSALSIQLAALSALLQIDTGVRVEAANYCNQAFNMILSIIDSCSQLGGFMLYTILHVHAMWQLACS
jgi:hypothetical protein